MPEKVFITGGSGFVGSAIIRELVTRQHSVNALTNRHVIDMFGESVRSFRGDLFDSAMIDRAMEGCDAVIHVVGIIMQKPVRGVTFERIHFEGTKSIVDAAARNGIKRFIQMSALGSRPGAVSDYHKTKFRAEEYLRSSGLEWTIFRPSMIHGPQGDFMRMEAKWSRMKAPPFLFMPYFGAGLLGFGGAGMLQPIFVEDIGRIFVDALEKPRTIGEVYPIGGPDRISWSELHRISCKAITGKTPTNITSPFYPLLHPIKSLPLIHRLIVPMPAWVARMLAVIVPNALLGFNRDQVIMSQEDNTCDLSKFEHDFGWTPQPFEATLKDYASRI